MHIILLERIENLGSIGQEVSVKRGYARNYLLPQGKALVANDRNRARFARERADIEARNEANRTAAAEIGQKIDGITLVLIRQAGDTGQLYGSVTARDIVDAARAEGHAIERRYVQLSQPIKTIGLHEVDVRLHAEVVVKITANVSRSPEEAERQAAGVNIVDALREEQTAIASEQAAALAEANAEMADMRGGDDE